MSAVVNDAVKALDPGMLQGFTARQLKFVNAMLHCCGDVVAASERAGMSVKEGARLSKKQEVRALFYSIKEDFAEAASYLVPRLARQMLVNAVASPLPIWRALECENWMEELEKLPPELHAMIQEIGFSKAGKPYARLVNKPACADVAGRLMGDDTMRRAQETSNVLGIQVIFRAADGASTEVKAIAGDVDVSRETPA